jgi:hypothetical protein
MRSDAAIELYATIGSMSFHHFDSLTGSNEFWTLPIDRINQNLERNHRKDSLQRPGISAIIGCPLPQDVRERIAVLQHAFDRTLLATGSKARVEWRKSSEALHFSVYGLTTPDDYRPGESWPLSEEQLRKIKDALRSYGGFSMQLRGIGILGMGAVSVRVSDSPGLERLRDAIASIQGMSRERFGSRTKKIVIGRLLPVLNDQDRSVIRDTCKKCEAISVGDIKADALEIIHYKNTFLDAEFERIHIPFGS